MHYTNFNSINLSTVHALHYTAHHTLHYTTIYHTACTTLQYSTSIALRNYWVAFAGPSGRSDNMTSPSHVGFCRRVWTLGMLACRTSASGILSCHLCVGRNLRRQPRWKRFSCLACLSDSPGLTGAQEGGQYYCTIDFSLVLKLSHLCSKTVLRSLPDAALALAILLQLSASMFTALFAAKNGDADSFR